MYKILANHSGTRSITVSESHLETLEKYHLLENQYLIQSPHTVLSPHVAGWTVESKFKLASVLADKIIDALNDNNTKA